MHLSLLIFRHECYSFFVTKWFFNIPRDNNAHIPYVHGRKVQAFLPLVTQARKITEYINIISLGVIAPLVFEKHYVDWHKSLHPQVLRRERKAYVRNNKFAPLVLTSQIRPWNESRKLMILSRAWHFYGLCHALGMLSSKLAIPGHNFSKSVNQSY